MVSEEYACFGRVGRAGTLKSGTLTLGARAPSRLITLRTFPHLFFFLSFTPTVTVPRRLRWGRSSTGAVGMIRSSLHKDPHCEH